MNVDPADPRRADRDRFVLSKGPVSYTHLECSGEGCPERGWKSFVHVFLLSGELNAVYASWRWEDVYKRQL